MKDRDSSNQEADHHAKMLPSTAWLLTTLQAKNTTVGIVATCNRRSPDLQLSITAEIAYYIHGSLITHNCQWKYLLRPTTSKIAITHHRQLLLQGTTSPPPHLVLAVRCADHTQLSQSLLHRITWHEDGSAAQHELDEYLKGGADKFGNVDITCLVRNVIYCTSLIEI